MVTQNQAAQMSHGSGAVHTDDLAADKLTLMDYVVALTITTIAGMSTAIGGWLAIRLLKYNVSADTGLADLAAENEQADQLAELSWFARLRRIGVKGLWQRFWAFMFDLSLAAYLDPTLQGIAGGPLSPSHGAAAPEHDGHHHHGLFKHFAHEHVAGGDETPFSTPQAPARGLPGGSLPPPPLLLQQGQQQKAATAAGQAGAAGTQTPGPAPGSPTALLGRQGSRRGVSGRPSFHTRVRLAYRILGAAQAFGGGVMVCVCAIDLVPESLKELGWAELGVWHVLGVALFMLVVYAARACVFAHPFDFAHPFPSSLSSLSLSLCLAVLVLL